MNISQVGDDEFEFEIYNLLGSLDGHYTFRWKRDGSYVFKQHGEYANLISFRPVEEEFRSPTEAEKEELDEIIDEVVTNAVFFDASKSLCRGDRLVPGGWDIIYAHMIFDRRNEHP